MPELPREMIANRDILVLPGGGHLARSLVAMMSVLAAGCASHSAPPPGWNARASFPQSPGEVEVIVYGRLGDLLPAYDATPWLERFLYGPNDYGKTVLRNPQGMTLLGDRLLVCDQGTPEVIAIHLPSGQSLPWGDADHPPRCPVDVTVGPDGRVYVADTTIRSVLVFEPGGAFVEELTPSRDPQRAFRPAAVRVVGRILYMGNIGERRIERWHIDERRWLAPLVPPEPQPGFIAPTGLAAGPRGELLAVDSIRRRVYRVTPDGEWLNPIGRPGRRDGEFVRPKHVCSTPGGLVLVTDTGRQSVLVFDGDGRYLTEVHERPDHWRGWTLPAGLIEVRPADLQVLMGEMQADLLNRLDSCIIVSDSLGGDSLTVLGIAKRAP